MNLVEAVVKQNKRTDRIDEGNNAHDVSVLADQITRMLVGDHTVALRQLKKTLPNMHRDHNLTTGIVNNATDMNALYNDVYRQLNRTLSTIYLRV